MQHASVQATGPSSAQDRKSLASTTSEKPTPATATDKFRRFFENTKNPETTTFERKTLTQKKEKKHPLQREHGDRKHDVQADRVARALLHPPRRHEVHG